MAHAVERVRVSGQKGLLWETKMINQAYSSLHRDWRLLNDRGKRTGNNSGAQEGQGQ